MALDVSAANFGSGRKALQLAADSGGSSVQEIALLLAQEAEDYRISYSLDPIYYSPDYTTCDHHTALEVAASAGHVNAVERLLEAGADPNAPLHDAGISALEAAAAQGQIIVVQMLLDRGAQPDHIGKRWETTPLIAAVMAGHIEICEVLVQSGADVSSVARRRYPCFSAIEAAGKTLSITLMEVFLGVVEDTAKEFDPEELEVAIAEGRQEDLRRLLRTKEFLKNAQTAIDRALCVVAATGNMLMLQRLLDAGAGIIAHSIGSNAIAAAASGGHLEAMNKLLQIASDRNILDEDAVTMVLQSAVNAGETALIEPLLQNGAHATTIDITRVAAEGRCDVLASILQSRALKDCDSAALPQAAHHGHQAVVELLLAKGASVNKYEDYGGDTALQLAVASGHLTVTRLLIDAGADVNASGGSAETPLQAAVRRGDTTVLELLLVAGADVDVVKGSESYIGAVVGVENRVGRQRAKTALSVAAEVGNLDLVARFLSEMSPECARQAVPWALLEAVENHHADIVRQLLQTHPDVNRIRGELQELTFLQTAAANGNLEILEMLLSEGADVNLNPDEGWQPTALQFSSERGDLAAVKLLLAAGAEVNVTGRTAPPLLLAIRGGHVQVFEHLLAAGADIHAVAYRGQTMLEAAEDSGGADTLDRVRAALDLRPPQPIDQPLDQGTGPLCDVCRLVPFVELFREQAWGHKIDLHPSLAALRASAAAGCPFCCFLWKRLGITTISIPQPSPVHLSQDQQKETLYCHASEPFPRDATCVEEIRAEFLSFPTFFGELSSLKQ